MLAFPSDGHVGRRALSLASAAESSIVTRTPMMPKTRRRLVVAVVSLMLAVAAIQWGSDVARAFEDSRPSTSIGTVSNGHLENGKRLPTSGPNFVVYSRLGALLGRDSVNSSVRDVVVDAYRALEVSARGWRFT